MTEQAQALQESERKLTAAARLAHLGYWDIDVVANRVGWSEESARLLGLSPTDRTRSWDEFLQLVYPDDRPRLEECRARIQRGDPAGPVAFRLALPDGTIRYTETAGETVIDENGRPIRTVGAVQDVSGRKRADDVLRDSEERFQVALQATGLGPWDWDLTTNTVEFWPEWKRQIGYEPHEIANRYEEWETRLHPDDRGHVLAALRDYLDGRRPEYALEFRLRHRNGTYRWIYTRGVVLHDAAGGQTHMIGCHLDITDRKQLEEQYRQSQKMQAVGQLAGGIAHDFNNLLVVIGGYADLIAEELGPSHPVRRDLDEIRSAARSAATLTRQLLAFSRRQILQPHVLDLNQVLRRMQQMLGRVIGEHITLVMNLAATGRVCADPGLFDQVVLNLAVNARDAMPNGGRLLLETADADLDATYAAAHRGVSPGRHVMLSVSDTGAGMDETTRTHLFEPFFTTKPSGQGTGLGLATVYGIVKQSGGSIWVYSELGKGSTFNTVIAASHGADAVAASRAHDGPIDVMLADVVLPGASGRAVARQVVADRPSLRVLYMSGYTENAVDQHGVLEPGLAFIQKPFSSEALVRG